MGKLLIIKNADFSVNAIGSEDILTIGYPLNVFASAANISQGGSSSYCDQRYANLYNKHISILEVKVAVAGTFSVFGYQNNTRTLKTTLTFTEDMVGRIVRFPVSIDVGANEMICFVDTTDTGSIYYNYGPGVGCRMYLRCARPGIEPTLTDNETALCVNIYTTN